MALDGEGHLNLPERARPSDKQRSVVVLGECLVDVVDAPSGISRHVGGAPANVARGIARGGHDVVLVTCLGPDSEGRFAAAELFRQGVRVAKESHRPFSTPTSTIRIDRNGHMDHEIRFDAGWSIEVPPMHESQLVHTGSAALFDSRVGDAMLRAATRTRPLLTVDPNVRPGATYDQQLVARFEAAAAIATIIKLSDEDAQILYPKWTVDQILDRMRGLGATVTVVTHGRNGAVGVGPSGRFKVPGYRVHEIDTVGAGDAYMASLILSLLDEPTDFGSAAWMTSAMIRASAAGALAVTVRGSQPPTRDELDSFLHDHGPV